MSNYILQYFKLILYCGLPPDGYITENFTKYEQVCKQGAYTGHFFLNAVRDRSNCIKVLQLDKLEF